jgi:hypothetical protein
MVVEIIARVVATAPRVIGIVAMVVGMVPRVMETFGRVMEMAGLNQFFGFITKTAAFSVVWPAPGGQHGSGRRVDPNFLEPDQCGLSRAGF